MGKPDPMKRRLRGFAHAEVGKPRSPMISSFAPAN